MFFESTIDFHYEPIVDKQINAVIVVGFLEEKHHLGVHGYMWKLGNNQVAGVELVHRINAIKRPIEDPLGAHHTPLAAMAGNVSLEIMQVIGVEGGFQECQALGLPIHGANIGERPGRGGHPIAVDDHDVFRQEVGAPVVNNAGPLAAGGRLGLPRKRDVNGGDVVQVQHPDAQQAGGGKTTDDARSSGGAHRPGVGVEPLMAGKIVVDLFGHPPAAGKLDIGGLELGSFGGGAAGPISIGGVGGAGLWGWHDCYLRRWEAILIPPLLPGWPERNMIYVSYRLRFFMASLAINSALRDCSWLLNTTTATGPFCTA